MVSSLLLGWSTVRAAEPPTINPFGPTPAQRDWQRDDAVPGCVELSDGSVHSGLIYLTRDKRVKIYDQQLERQREIPLRVVRQIDCAVEREWIEREWHFKETTSDEKIYTGRTYPAREYLHTITLRDGRSITGPLSEIIYLQPQDDSSRSAGHRAEPKVEKFLLHKRDKGELGQDPKSLIYVKRIKLGATKERSEAGASERENPKSPNP
jgi:hypothetical protein